MADIWANVKTVLATEVPGDPCAGIFCIMTRHPIGLMGVELWSNVSLKYIQADVKGFRVACWGILRLSLACSRRSTQRYFWKESSMPARMSRKWSLKVCMERLTALCLCTSEVTR